MDVEKEIQQIKARNKAVESHKAWEVSVFRRMTITIFTYFVAFLWMWIAELDKAWIAAFVPALAYFISTLSIPPLRAWWIKRLS